VTRSSLTFLRNGCRSQTLLNADEMRKHVKQCCIRRITAKFLKISPDRLSKLAKLQRREELKRDLAGPPALLFKEVREVILRKCLPEKEKQVRAIFEKQPFGELERLVTQKLLDVIEKVAKEELNSENWLHLVARIAGRLGGCWQSH
jgi:DNA-directed RNA polymerase subunit F